MRPLLVSIRTIAQQNPQQKTLLARILSHKMSSDSKYPGLTSGPFNWINNKRVESSLPETFEDVEPRTGKVLAKVPVSGQAELDQAVLAAKAAFPAWSQMSGMERGRIMIRAACLIRDNLEEFARAETLDNGKPIWESRMDLDTVTGCLDYYGGMAASLTGQHVKMGGGSWAYVTREPLGVVGGIGAWNYPMQTCMWKVAPALATGNTFVYKPSPLSPLTAVMLGQVLAEAGLPPGVFGVVQGAGETGALMTKHPGFAKFSFTGSVPTGTKIMQAAAERIQNITLELGGKSPMIVFDDADLKNAVKGALMANFFTQGEVCSNGTRIFVQRGIYDSFLSEFVKHTQKLKVGDPFGEDTTVGATICKDHAEKVMGYIKLAKEEGCTIQCGGERVVLPGDLSGGYYLSPCVLTECHDDMRVIREEIFGAVAAVLPFDTEEEAIRRANDTQFGLGGGVFTKDIQRAHRVISQVDAGSCWINTYNLAPPEVPFGGFKASGIGRENGHAALEHYTQTKTVYVEMNDVDCGLLYKED